MKKQIIIFILSVFFLSFDLKGDVNIDEFIAACRYAREYWEITRDINKNENNGSKININEIPENIRIVPMLRYLEFRNEFRNDSSKFNINELIDDMNISMADEYTLLYIFWCRENSVSSYPVFPDAIHFLYPILVSSLSWEKTYKEGIRIMIDSNPPAPEIPSKMCVYKLNLKGKYFLEIAKSLDKIKLYDFAWRNYALHLCREYRPASIKENENIICHQYPDVAKYWLRAAECAYIAGRKDICWDFLMKAAVYGDDDTYDMAIKTAKLWADSEKEGKNPYPDSEKPVDDKEKAKELEKIINLYAKMNTHPRAFELIKKNWDILDNPQKLYDNLSVEWKKVVKYSRDINLKKYILWGTEVWPEGDPMKVRIPWAFEEDSVEKIKKLLKDNLNNKEKTPK